MGLRRYVKGNWNAVHKQIIIFSGNIFLRCSQNINQLHFSTNYDNREFRNISNIYISHSYENVFVLVLHFVQFMMLMISERTFYQDI